MRLAVCNVELRGLMGPCLLGVGQRRVYELVKIDAPIPSCAEPPTAHTCPKRNGCQHSMRCTAACSHPLQCRQCRQEAMLRRHQLQCTCLKSRRAPFAVHRCIAASRPGGRCARRSRRNGDARLETKDIASARWSNSHWRTHMRLNNTPRSCSQGLQGVRSVALWSCSFSNLKHAVRTSLQPLCEAPPGAGKEEGGGARRHRTAFRGICHGVLQRGCSLLRSPCQYPNAAIPRTLCSLFARYGLV